MRDSCITLTITIHGLPQVVSIQCVLAIEWNGNFGVGNFDHFIQLSQTNIVNVCHTHQLWARAIPEAPAHLVDKWIVNDDKRHQNIIPCTPATGSDDL